MTRALVATAVIGAAVLAAGTAPGFDHQFDAYRALLQQYVRPPAVDYRSLKRDRARLDVVVQSFAAVDGAEERRWTRDERFAFWINAYNAFTVQAIVDHYPIRSGWLTLQPRNSIRQIDGVWTRLTWPAAGRTVTLDDIEHRILRPEFGDPRVHFAINCASVGCPPLADEPYRAAVLTAQLDAAARRYLARPQGVRVDGRTLRVSSIFKWYGGDFTARFGTAGPPRPDPIERAILGVVQAFGPPDAAALARAADVRIAFLDYDWSLNDAR